MLRSISLYESTYQRHLRAGRLFPFSIVTGKGIRGSRNPEAEQLDDPGHGGSAARECEETDNDTIR